MKTLADWIRSHPIATTFLALVGGVWALIAFTNAVAEWRWQTYCVEARARGVKLTLAEFVPPPIPDEENFAALPTLLAAFQSKRPMQLPDRGKSKAGFSDPKKGVRLDWDAWRQCLGDAEYLRTTTESAPADVLAALEHYRPQFDDWSQWRTRPRCRFPLDWQAGIAMPLPHLSTFNDAAQLFRLRMSAHLALSDAPAACADFREGLQAYHALKEEPTLIAGLVQISALIQLIFGVGDGLADHAWAERELQQVESDLAPIRVWDDFQRAFASERGFANSIYDQLLKAASWQRANVLGGLPLGGPPVALMPWIPKGIYRKNQLRQNHYFDEILARVNPEGTRFDPDLPTPSGVELLKGFDQYRYFLFKLSSPIYSDLDHRFVLLHTRIAQARIAIALERFRLRHAHFPEALAELVPGFLAEIPTDPYSRQPMVYRLKETGAFDLYSVGRNRTDDGAAVDPKRSDSSQKDDVWMYSPPGTAPARH